MFNLKSIILLLMVSFLAGCSSPWTNIHSYDREYGKTTKLIPQFNIPANGSYIMRRIVRPSEPNEIYMGLESSKDYVNVVDFWLELKQTSHGDYYRLHIIPQKLSKSITNQWKPWIIVKTPKPDSLFFPVKLPENFWAKADSGQIISEWFICDSCFKENPAKFTSMVQARSADTYAEGNKNWLFDFVETPTHKPNWSGNIEAREQQIQAELDAKEEEKQKKLDALAADLPPELRRDKYMVQLSTYLKKQDYKSALRIFPRLEALPVAQDPSLKFFYGEALLRTGSPQEALTKLYEYVNEQGRNATHYGKALKLINEAESQI
ncbi:MULTISPECIES: hypothetical protein [Thiomicrorhabdus]|uniref:Tetratricopeptide repeat protein n=1 Tax=Thiomicrorhabdus heinhorstiae TaxID=2748010 RepID=A0ABS0BTK9_9GAMM|nr:MULTISPECIES: hypothetical protein [Thiomicrorhabdus]MBF6057115.1 hypothetical protein [Thiomicrorhabdus heinhorstiae]